MELDGRRVLVIGAAGAQGSGLAPAVRERGGIPVHVTSKPERADALRGDGAEAVVADLADVDAVRAAAEEADVAAVAGILPLGFGDPRRAPLAVAAYLALRTLGVPVAVNVGSPLPADGDPDVTGTGATARALADAGATAVAPTGYLENHAAPWAIGAIAGGELVYPRPADDVIAWIAAADLGAAAVAALAGDLGGRVIRLAGPEPLTFTALAGELGAGLGRDLVFRPLTPREYGDLLRPFLGDDAAAGVERMYGSMPPTPSPVMNPPEASENWRLLGVQPTPAREWAARVLRPALEAAAVR